MKLERDPTDNKVAFFPAVTSFEIETLADAYMALAGLKQAAELFKENHGFTGYPILLIEDEE